MTQSPASCGATPHPAMPRAGGMRRASRVAIAFAVCLAVPAGCQSDRSESGQGTRAKPSQVVRLECGRGLVPPVTKNGLTVSLSAERSEPLDDDLWALSFRGRLTNRTDALVPEARGTVTSSDENSVVTRGQLYFGYIPPGESVYSADLVRIEQRGSDRVDGCAVMLGLRTPPHSSERGRAGSSSGPRLRFS